MAKGAWLGVGAGAAIVAALAVATSLALPPPGEVEPLVIPATREGESPASPAGTPATITTTVPVQTSPSPATQGATTEGRTSRPAEVPSDMPAQPDAHAPAEAMPAPDDGAGLPAGTEEEPIQRGLLVPRPKVALVPEAEIVVPRPASDRQLVEAPSEPAPAEGAWSLPRRLILDSEREEVMQAVGATSTVAASFDDDASSGSRPLLAIVLTEPQEGRLDVAAELQALDLPVTFAIDAGRPGAADRARVHRAAGREVAVSALPPVEGATPQDIEIALAGARAAVPDAVGVVDGAAEGFAARRDALATLLPALAETGMGVVVPPGGLGTAVADARRLGVPAVALYRLLDGRGEGAEVVSRYLDRAVFEAARAGAVVVMGTASTETVEGIAQWVRRGGADAVRAVPLSHVLESAGLDG